MMHFATQYLMRWSFSAIARCMSALACRTLSLSAACVSMQRGFVSAL